MKLSKKVFIQATLKDVWNEITNINQIKPYFFGYVLHIPELRPGSELKIQRANGKYVVVEGQVVELEAPFLFSHTFSFTSNDDTACNFTYQLTQVNNKVELSLSIDGLEEGSESHFYLKKSLNYILNALKAFVEKGRVPIKAKIMIFLSRVALLMSRNALYSER